MWGSPRRTLSHLQHWFWGFANSPVPHHGREDPQHSTWSHRSKTAGEPVCMGWGGKPELIEIHPPRG